MQQDAAFHLGPDCLLKCSLRGFQYTNGNKCINILCLDRHEGPYSKVLTKGYTLVHLLLTAKHNGVNHRG